MPSNPITSTSTQVSAPKKQPQADPAAGFFLDFDAQIGNGLPPPQSDFVQRYNEQFGQNKKPNQQLVADDQWDYKTATTDKAGNPLPKGATGFDPYGRAYYGEGLGGWWNGVVSRISEPDAKVAQFDFTRPNTDLMTTVGNIASNVEQAGNLSDSFGVNSPLTPVLRTVKEGIGGLFTALSLPSQLFERVVGTASELMRSDRQARDVGEAWEASRITYSSFFDVSRRDQFLERLRQGENPEFLAMQLEDTTKEFWGQMILDPTFIWGWGAKGAKTARTLEITAAKLTRTGAGASDEVLAIIDNLSSGAEKLDDIAAAGKLATVSQAVNTAMDATKAGMLTYKPGFFSRLTSAQRAVTSLNTGRYFQWTVDTMRQLGKNEDEIGDALYHAAMLASDNPEQRSVALSYILRHHPVPKMALAEDGLQSSHVLWKGIGDNPEDFLAGMQKAAVEGPDKIIEFAQSKIDDVSKEMYPSVTDMREASQAVAKGKPTARQAALAKQYETMPPGVKAAEQFASSMIPTQYRKIQGTLTGIYLSSPGYVVRNMINNTFTGVVDQGARLFFGRGGKAMVGGGKLGDKMFMFQKAANNLNEMLGSTTYVDTIGGITKSAIAEEGLKVTQIVPKAADASERGMRVMIERASVQDSLEKLLKPGKFLPDTAPLVERGMTPEQASMFARYVLDANGDIDKAIVRFKNAGAATGAVDTWRDTTQLISLKMRRFLGKSTLDDVIQDAIHAQYATADEAVEGVVGRVRKAIDEQAKNVADDVIAVSDKHPGATIAADLTEAQKAGYLTAGQSEHFGAMIQAGRNLEEYSVNAGHQLAALANGGSQTFEIVNKILQAFPLAGSKVANETKRLTDEAWQFTNQFRSGKLTANPLSLYQKYLPDLPPKATQQEFVNDLWQTRHANVKQQWMDYYAGLKTRVDTLYGELGKLMPSEKEASQAQAIIQNGDRLFGEYEQVRSAVYDGTRLVRDPLEGLQGGDYVKKLASMYGYSTATEAGVSTEKNLLQTINKYSPEAVSKKAIAEEGAQAGLQTAAESVARERRSAERLEVDFMAGIRRLTPEEIAKNPKIDRLEATPELKAKQQAYYDEVKAKSAAFQADLKAHPEKYDFGPDKAQFAFEAKDKWNVEKNYAAFRAEYYKRKGYPDPLLSGGRRATDKPLLTGSTAEVSGQLAESSGISLKGGERVVSDAPLGSLYGSIDEVPPEVAKQALENWRIAKGRPEVSLGQPVTVPYAGNAPSPARLAHESMRGIEPELQRMEQFIRDNWGQSMGSFGDEIDDSLNAYAQSAKPLIAQARAVAQRVGHEAGNFALLDYVGGKKGFDAAAQYVMPLEFWPSRTYTTWAQRAYTDPHVLASYGRFKQKMEKEHADMPEFYKYNVNTNELLGMNSESPLFFNLEAAIWPLNGLTGVDFNDPYKRTDWWTATLDDMGKVGPGIATPITAMTALSLYMQGEKEAASRWAGRLFPQTTQIKSVLALGNVQLPDTPVTKGNELDPFVNFFSGGEDPYERRRIGGAGLQQLVDSGKITAEQALDAANKQSGPIWDMAKQMSTKQRAGANLSSWGLGVGWKGRTPTDLRIDKFYQEYTALSKKIKGGALSPDATKQAFDELRKKYDFMDLVILSKKFDEDRDRAYAYNTLSRMPPGQVGDLATAAGISEELIQKFYDDKGNVGAWEETDRQKFMAGITDLAAVLAIPDNATQDDWNKARSAYRGLNEGLKQQYGPDIHDKTDAYFAIGNETQKQRDLQRDYLKLHPEVQQAMDLRTKAIAATPALNAYYGGIRAVEKYYTMEMYSDLKEQLGSDIFDKFDEYGTLKLYDPREAAKFYRANPQLKQYSELRGEWQNYINQQVARVGSTLRPGQPAQLRPAETTAPPTVGSQAVQNVLQPQPQKTWQEWATIMPEPLTRLVLDYFRTGDEISPAGERYLERLAGDYGFETTDELLQSMGSSLFQSQP